MLYFNSVYPAYFLAFFPIVVLLYFALFHKVRWMWFLKTCISKLLLRHKPLITYFMASATMAVLDVALVHLLNSVMTVSIVWINTISIILTSVIHYIWITKRTFESSLGIRSAVIYLITFVAGVVWQDFVVWVCYEHMALSLIVSKSASLMASFFILYGARKLLYKKFGDNTRKG